MTKSSTATIRYRNLVGQRYISLTQGVGNLDQLPADATIPLSRTQPALDLTVLFNGFKPLFAALSPADINKLSAEIVQIFQGEGGNLNQLLTSTASLTNTLADRDQVIGDTIDNLNSVLGTIAGRDKELSSLIVQFKNFMAGLVQDKDVILGSLDSVSALANQTADLTVGIRPSFVKDVKQPALGGHQPERRPRRARPGDADPADQAAEDRPHGDLRLVLQLLPVPVPGQRERSPVSRSRSPTSTNTFGKDARCNLK